MADDPIREAHALLAVHYGEEVLPVGQVCQALAVYARTLREQGEDGPFPPDVAQAIREHGEVAVTFARKSNLLFRLLYLGEPVRREPCPEHGGHWSGCQPEPCPHGCSSGRDVTGWLAVGTTPGGES